MKMNMEQIKKWWANPANKTKKFIAVAVALFLVLAVFWYGINKLVDWLHDVNYQNQQSKDKDAANKSETNASQHESTANQAAANQKELEKDEQAINQNRAASQKEVDAAKRNSKSTRDAYDRARNAVPANRSGTDGISDDQLRADSNRAAAAFNGQ